MEFWLQGIFFVLLLALELVYFRIANRYGIVDQPNHRSSHNQITIRGGGVIFPVGALLYSLYAGFTFPWFISGLLAISFISFIDDVRSVSNRVRIIVHLVAVALLFQQVQLFALPWYLVLLSLVFVIGTVNAINFMDGINGITGGYGLVALSTLYYVQTFVVPFTDSGLLITTILAVLVFNFFNFRVKAACFAGDVGSVSLAFVITFFLLQLITATQNLNYLGLLLVYGLDAGTTILFRLIRKENIFEAHRSHFYQYLANEKKVRHVLIALGYMVVQGIINLSLIAFLPQQFFYVVVFSVIAAIIFIVMRLITEGPKKLMYTAK
jgi:UDP-GlcNAc:undecaprenyl-phosphate/decaprenyl-phosphate GlcNAc-1-phosphate transferase